ncbi:hypothetical protein ACFLSX_00785 [Calditrichota bacterium]
MSSFWIGLILTFIATIITSLYSIFTLDSFYLRLKTFVHWLPFKLTLAFLSGFYIDLVTSTSNEFGKGTIVILFALICAFVASTLEYNLFIIKSAWKADKLERVRRNSFCLFVFALSVSLVPFVLYDQLTGINFLIFLSILIVAPFFNYYWNYIYDSAHEDLRGRLLTILSSRCVTSFIKPNFSNEELLYKNGSIAELQIILDITEKSFKNIVIFNPIVDGEPIPGAKSSVLPITKIKEIGLNVTNEFLNTLSVNRAKLKLLLDNDVEIEDSYDIVLSKCGLEMAELLKYRRLELHKS